MKYDLIFYICYMIKMVSIKAIKEERNVKVYGVIIMVMEFISLSLYCFKCQRLDAGCMQVKDNWHV